MRAFVNTHLAYAEKNYKLMNDLDFSTESDWIPMGSFKGTFDGGKNVILNMQIGTKENPSSLQHAGLFSRVIGGTVKDLGVQWAGLYTTTASYSSSYAGGIAGYAEKSNIATCHTSGEISAISSNATAYVGGIAGYGQECIVPNCYATGAVSGSMSGGILGYNIFGTVSNCYATGDISADANASNTCTGGIVGCNTNGSISNCYASGNITAYSPTYGYGYYYAGGIAGYNEAGSIVYNYGLNAKVVAITKSRNKAYACRIAYSKSGTLVDNLVHPSMTVQTGTTYSNLADVSISGTNHGSQLTSDPVNLLNAWVQKHPTTSNGIKHLSWEVGNQENNGRPVFVKTDEPTSAITLNETNVKAYSTTGLIVVENANAPISIFNANGILVKTIANTNVIEKIELQSGYYIVCIGSTSNKVIVD